MHETKPDLKAGDAASLAQLFELYADPIYRLAMSLLHDPAKAEDVLQETFLSAWTHAADFEGRSSLRSWLYRIAYNASIDRLRRQREEPLPGDIEVDEDQTPPPMPAALVEWVSPEQLFLRTELTQELDHAIQNLPTNLRAVFVLRDIEGLSTEETADILGISPANVKVRLHRARLQLRERLTGAFFPSKGDHHEV